MDAIVSLARSGLGTLLRTAAGMFVLAVLTALVCARVAGETSAARGALAAVVAFGLLAAAGAMLSVKRAVLRALLAGLQKLGLASSATNLVFDRVLGGEGGGAVAVANKVPLAQAEQRLRGAVGSLRRLWPDVAGARWLQRRIESWLILNVERLTLARFREDGRRDGAVDLARVKTELGARIDGMLVGHVARAITRITILALALGIGGSLLFALALRRL